MTSSDRSGRRFTVLDIETVPEADALSHAPRHSSGGHGRPALHKIVSVTVLIGAESVDGFTELDLRTFAHPDVDEVTMIGCVDLLLPEASDDTSRLVTWNGRHDLRVLRLRACSQWMFDLPRLAAWYSVDDERHVDVMRSFSCGDPRGDWRLADACAGLGFAVRVGVPGRPVSTLHHQGRHAAVAEHNRMDVAGTFLAYAYQRSFETGSDLHAATAWLGLSELLPRFGCTDQNVQPLATHHLVSLAKRRLSARP